LGCSKSCSKRGVYSNTALPQEAGKISDILTLYLKELDKEEESPKPVQKAKVRAEINEIETKKMEQMNQELVL